MIENFENSEIVIDEEDLEIDNTEESEPESSINGPVQEESPRPPKPKKRRIMNPESKKLPYEPDAPANKPESWSDNPDDYI